MCKFLLLGLFWPVWLLLFLFVLFVGFWLFSFAQLMANVGYLHFLQALYRWSSSFCNSCGLEHTVLALWYRVPATLYLDEMVWWLSHCKYRSVWVGFLNTDVLRLPSSSGVTKVSRNSMDPSSFTSSQVNLMFGWMELRCCRKLFLSSFLMIVNVSSTYLLHKAGGVYDVLMAWTSRSSIDRFATIPMTEPTIDSTSWAFIEQVNIYDLQKMVLQFAIHFVPTLVYTNMVYTLYN